MLCLLYVNYDHAGCTLSLRRLEHSRFCGRHTQCSYSPPCSVVKKAEKALAIFNFVKGEAGEIDKCSNFFLTILSGVNVQ